MRGGVGLWWRCCLEGESSCSSFPLRMEGSIDGLTVGTDPMLGSARVRVEPIDRAQSSFLPSLLYNVSVTYIRRNRRFGMYNKLMEGGVQLIPHFYRKRY